MSDNNTAAMYCHVLTERCERFFVLTFLAYVTMTAMIAGKTALVSIL